MTFCLFHIQAFDNICIDAMKYRCCFLRLLLPLETGPETDGESTIEKANFSHCLCCAEPLLCPSSLLPSEFKSQLRDRERSGPEEYEAHPGAGGARGAGGGRAAVRLVCVRESMCGRSGTRYSADVGLVSPAPQSV